MICLWKIITVLLLDDWSVGRNNDVVAHCSVMCNWKGIMFSLQYNLSLGRKNVAVRFVFGKEKCFRCSMYLKGNRVFDALRYVLNPTTFYFYHLLYNWHPIVNRILQNLCNLVLEIRGRVLGLIFRGTNDLKRKVGAISL